MSTVPEQPDGEEEIGRRRGRRAALFWAKAAWLVAAAAILFFLGRSLATNWARLNLSPADVGWGWLAASAVLFAVGYAASAVVWRKSLALFDAPPGYSKCLEIIILSQLPKYLPGGIWTVVGQIELSKRAGVKRSSAVLAVGMMSAAVVVAGIAFGLIAGAPVIALGRGRLVAAALGLVALVVCASPAVFSRIAKVAFLLAGREPPRMSLSARGVGDLLVTALGYWPIAGLGFYAMAAALAPVSAGDALPLAGAFAVSWTIGYVAVFAPGGIGVREGILALLLSKLVGMPAAILISLGQRVWFTVMELVLAGAWLGLAGVRARMRGVRPADGGGT